MSASELRFGIVCAAWNCAQWVTRSLHSIQQQTHANLRCVLIDAASSDTTFETARSAVAGDERFTILRNETRNYPLANIVRATRLVCEQLGPQDVVVIVDADDWLKHERVLERVAQIYADPEVWISYGSAELLNRPWKARLLNRVVRGQAAPYPRAVAERSLYRYMPGKYLATHLRAYRRFLWDALPDVELRDPETGDYYRTAADPATMWPMMEMATAQHIRYVDDILYVYNNNHPLAERGHGQRWTETEQFLTNLKLRARRPLAPLPADAAGVMP